MPYVLPYIRITPRSDVVKYCASSLSLFSAFPQNCWSPDTDVHAAGIPWHHLRRRDPLARRDASTPLHQHPPSLSASASSRPVFRSLCAVAVVCCCCCFGFNSLDGVGSTSTCTPPRGRYNLSELRGIKRDILDVPGARRLVVDRAPRVAFEQVREACHFASPA